MPTPTPLSADDFQHIEGWLPGQSPLDLFGSEKEDANRTQFPGKLFRRLRKIPGKEKTDRAARPPTDLEIEPRDRIERCRVGLQLGLNEESLPAQGHQSVDFLLGLLARIQANGEWSSDPICRRRDQPEGFTDPMFEDPARLLRGQVAAHEAAGMHRGVHLGHQFTPAR